MTASMERLEPGPVKLRFSTESELGSLFYHENVIFLEFRSHAQHGTVGAFLGMDGQEFEIFPVAGSWCYRTPEETVTIIN